MSPAKPENPDARAGKPSALEGDRRWPSVAVCLFLAGIVWAAFGRTIHHDFVSYDDGIYVYENPTVTNGLTWSGVRWAFSGIHVGNWHPLTLLSHMLDCQLYGLNPAGHHFTSVLLHAATAALLFLALRALTGAFWRCAFVAAVFAVHPLRAESVAWIAERKDVLSGLFFMLTLLAYARFVREQGAGIKNTFSFFRSPAYWLSLFFFACGLMSKPMLVTLPCILLLLDFWPLGRIRNSEFGIRKLKPLLLEKIPFLILVAADCAATVWAQGNAVKSVDDVHLVARLGNAVISYAEYVVQMVWPTGLAVFYPHPGNVLPAEKLLLSSLLLAFISIGVLLGWRRRPYLLAGWLWYLGMLVPVIGLMQVGYQAHADRYTYLPQIGLYFMLVWAAAEAFNGWRHRKIFLGTAAVALLAALLALARAQTAYWKDSVSLWTHTVACTSGSILAHDNLSYAFTKQGRWAEAAEQCRQALQLNPGYVPARVNLGYALTRQGEWDAAVAEYERALRTDPGSSTAHYNLGVALETLGRLPEAVGHYERAIQINPDYIEARLNLGHALTLQGRLRDAAQSYERALQTDSGNAVAHFKLGEILDSRGETAAAARHYERALQTNPDYAEAHSNLGIILATQGQAAEAAGHFEQAVRLAPADAEIRFNLGRTLAIRGDLSQAAFQLQRALNLAEAQTNSALAETVRRALKACAAAAPGKPNP
jgi:tetratricopeptide (TPR) repeat protein